MTDNEMISSMLWCSAMAHMGALNTELSHKQTAPWMLHGMRAVAEARLSDYFDEVERILARNPIPDTPGDRRRQAA